MTLEEKIAHWTELGITPYSEAMRIQNELVEARKKDLIPDTILSLQHPLTVNFGASSKDNQFSDELIQKVKSLYGHANDENVIKYLESLNIPFVISERGGGATVFAPGQYVFYPVVKHSGITGSHNLDLGAYKAVIYKTLFDSLKNLGVDGVNVGSSQSFATRNERRDAWIVRDGVTHKMGSKGFNVKEGVAYNGFALYVDAESVGKNWIVNQCGYRPDEVKLWTVEHEIGRKFNPQEVYGAVQNAMMSNFGYKGFLNKEILKPSREVMYGD